MPPYEPLMTTEEVAALLRRSPGTVKNWRHQGRGPRYVTTEGEVRYWRRDVEAWIDAHRSPARKGRKGSGVTAPRYRAAVIAEPKEEARAQGVD